MNAAIAGLIRKAAQDRWDAAWEFIRAADHGRLMAGGNANDRHFINQAGERYAEATRRLEQLTMAGDHT